MVEVTTTNPYTSVDSGTVRVVDRSGATTEIRTYSGGVLTRRQVTGSEEARKKQEAQYQYNRQVETIKKAGYSSAEMNRRLNQLGSQFRSNPIINPFKAGSFEYEFYQRVGQRPTESNIGREAFKNFQEGRYKSWSEFERDNPALFVDPALRQAFSEAFSSKLSAQLQQYELAKLFKGQVKPTSEEKSEYLKSLSPDERAKVERLGLEPVVRPIGMSIATQFITEKEAQRMAKIFPATKTEIAYLPLTPESKALVRTEQQKELKEEAYKIGEKVLKEYGQTGALLYGVSPSSIGRIVEELKKPKEERIAEERWFKEEIGLGVLQRRSSEEAIVGLGVPKIVAYPLSLGGYAMTESIPVIAGTGFLTGAVTEIALTKIPFIAGTVGTALKTPLGKTLALGLFVGMTGKELLDTSKLPTVREQVAGYTRIGAFLGGATFGALSIKPKIRSVLTETKPIKKTLYEGQIEYGKIRYETTKQIGGKTFKQIYEKPITAEIFTTKKPKVAIPTESVRYIQEASITPEGTLIRTGKTVGFPEYFSGVPKAKTPFTETLLTKGKLTYQRTKFPIYEKGKIAGFIEVQPRKIKSLTSETIVSTKAVLEAPKFKPSGVSIRTGEGISKRLLISGKGEPSTFFKQLKTIEFYTKTTGRKGLLPALETKQFKLGKPTKPFTYKVSEGRLFEELGIREIEKKIAWTPIKTETPFIVSRQKISEIGSLKEGTGQLMIAEEPTQYPPDFAGFQGIHTNIKEVQIFKRSFALTPIQKGISGVGLLPASMIKPISLVSPMDITKTITRPKEEVKLKSDIGTRLSVETIPAERTTTTTKPTTTTKVISLTKTAFPRPEPTRIRPKPEPEPIPILKIGVGLPTLKATKGRKVELMKFKAKKLKKKLFITPMPDPLSLLRTEATTFRPARQLPITREQARKFAKGYKQPLSYSYPTFEMAKGLVGNKKKVK